MVICFIITITNIIIVILIVIQVLGVKLEEVKDQVDFGTLLKDGSILCQ